MTHGLPLACSLGHFLLHVDEADPTEVDAAEAEALPGMSDAWWEGPGKFRRLATFLLVWSMYDVFSW